jgi:DNA-binding winged helix-turn-helix (wHTH) protein
MECWAKTMIKLGNTFVKGSLLSTSRSLPKLTATLAPMSSSDTNNVYHSADMTIYPHTGQVDIQGRVISLGLVNMQVLSMLLECAGDVVTRADFFDRVWKNQTVSDDTLTRCISELRSQLGKYSSQSKLIETLPKRGYRWVPAVIAPPMHKTFGGWKKVALTTISGLAALLLFTVGVLWLIDSSLRPELVRVALVPVYASQSGQVQIAADIDDLLKQRLLATENLRFLARGANGDGTQESYSRLYQHSGVQWIIEGDIRQRQQDYRVSLSLVDAKTALVVYTLTRDFGDAPVKLEQMTDSFIVEASQVMYLGRGR